MRTHTTLFYIYLQQEIVKDQIKRRTRKRKNANPKRTKLTYNCIRRIATDINVGWHLRLRIGKKSNNKNATSFLSFHIYMLSTLINVWMKRCKNDISSAFWEKKKMYINHSLKQCQRITKKNCRILNYNFMHELKLWFLEIFCRHSSRSMQRKQTVSIEMFSSFSTRWRFSSSFARRDVDHLRQHVIFFVIGSSVYHQECCRDGRENVFTTFTIWFCFMLSSSLKELRYFIQLWWETLDESEFVFYQIFIFDQVEWRRSIYKNNEQLFLILITAIKMTHSVHFSHRMTDFSVEKKRRTIDSSSL